MRPDSRETGSNFRQHRLTGVANQTQCSQFVKVSHMIDAPVARANHSNGRVSFCCKRFLNHVSNQFSNLVFTYQSGIDRNARRIARSPATQPDTPGRSPDRWAPVAPYWLVIV